MGFTQRRLLKGVLAVATHPRLTLSIVLVVLAASATLAITRLSISTDQNQLFSGNVSFFHDYLDFIHRFRENEAVYIIVEPRDPAAKPSVTRWTAAADAITNRLRGMPDHVLAATCKIPLDQLGRQGLLFEDPALVRAQQPQIGQFIPLAQFWGEKPGLTTQFLGHTPLERFLTGTTARGDEATAAFVEKLAHSWIGILTDPKLAARVGDGVVDLQKIEAPDPAQLGYFYVPNEMNRSEYRILVRVYPKSAHDSLTSVTQTVDAIRNAALDAAKPFGEFNIGVTGRPALEADEMRATDIDSHHAEIAAICGVFIGMSIMLRSLWLALAAEISLGVGIGWSFGWATLAVGQLNLLSLVFLIALIGIGMDYLVQILSRYRLEARRYQRPEAIWVRVFTHVGPPINTACLGAAGAFLVSIFTDFRGAANLGVIAGGGLILCLVAGYTVLPAILVLFPPKLKPFEAGRRYAKPRRGSAQRLVLPLLWLIGLGLGVPWMKLTHFDPGLIELQVPRMPSVMLIRTLQTWTAVVLSKDMNQLRQIRDALASVPAVAGTDSLLTAEDNYQWLHQHASDLPKINWAEPAPLHGGDLPSLVIKARKLADHFDPPTSHRTSTTSPATARISAARTLREFAAIVATFSADRADWAAGRLSDWQTAFVAELKIMLGQFDPLPLSVAELPAEMRSHYFSDDGYYALYITPKEDLWKRSNLEHFVRDVEWKVKTIPGAPPVTGIASNVYHTTGSIHNAFYKATVYAFVLIFILVLIDLRNLGHTLAAVSVLGLGLPMLLTIMGALGTSWNFANFFGLPILIGAGHEYGVFMVHRYLEAKKYPRRVWRRWDVSDRALLLCALITSSSFGFFWLLAEHEGLKSLGLVMTLGTMCIYLSALIVVRPILRWLLDRHYSRGALSGAASFPTNGPAIAAEDQEQESSVR